MSIKTEIIKSLPEWAKDIPYQIKSIAIKEAICNLKEQKKQARPIILLERLIASWAARSLSRLATRKWIEILMEP